MNRNQNNSNRSKKSKNNNRRRQNRAKAVYPSPGLQNYKSENKVLTQVFDPQQSDDHMSRECAQICNYFTRNDAKPTMYACPQFDRRFYYNNDYTVPADVGGYLTGGILATKSGNFDVQTGPDSGDCYVNWAPYHMTNGNGGGSLRYLPLSSISTVPADYIYPAFTFVSGSPDSHFFVLKARLWLIANNAAVDVRQGTVTAVNTVYNPHEVDQLANFKNLSFARTFSAAALDDDDCVELVSPGLTWSSQSTNLRLVDRHQYEMALVFTNTQPNQFFTIGWEVTYFQTHPLSIPQEIFLKPSTVWFEMATLFLQQKYLKHCTPQEKGQLAKVFKDHARKQSWGAQLLGLAKSAVNSPLVKGGLSYLLGL